MSAQVVLVVDFECSTCSFCGLGASYGAKTHTKALERGSVGPRQLRDGACGKRFNRTASSAASNRMAVDIKAKYPNLEFLGAGEVVPIGLGTECTFRLSTPANKFNSK